MPETPEMVERPWSEMVAPIVAKCEVAAAFGQEVCWNARGAEAIGKLLKQMASHLDAALAAPEEGRGS